MLIVETGLATGESQCTEFVQDTLHLKCSAVTAVVTLGLFLKFQSQLQYYIVPAFVISKLYSITLMVLLLNRPSTLKDRHEIRLENSRGPSNRGLDIDKNTNIQVTIHQEAYDDGLAMVTLPSTIDVSSHFTVFWTKFTLPVPQRSKEIEEMTVSIDSKWSSRTPAD